MGKHTRSKGREGGSQAHSESSVTVKLPYDGFYQLHRGRHRHYCYKCANRTKSIKNSNPRDCFDPKCRLDSDKPCKEHE